MNDKECGIDMTKLGFTVSGAALGIGAVCHFLLPGNIGTLAQIVCAWVGLAACVGATFAADYLQ